MARYLFQDYVSSPDASNWHAVLVRAHAAKIRPVCLCKSKGEGAQMYIAKHRESCFIKRMPFSGVAHAPHCEHYEPPSELSGLGQVNGTAIREDAESNAMVLSLDFALTKGKGRAITADPQAEHESVRSDGTKLTMRATLHFLYDQAGLSRWSPRMAGRRSWAVVRRELYIAATDKRAKGLALNELLFIPETFVVNDAHMIAERRASALARLSASAANRMLMVAEVKLVEPTRFGHKITFKHMPDMPLTMTEDLQKRLSRVFENELALWGQLETTHLLLIGTMSLSPQGFYVLESACLTNVNEAWIPFDSFYEYQLLDTLHMQGRKFTKGLRYNLPSTKPLASVVLQDTGDVSAALYIVPSGAHSDYEDSARQLTERSDMVSWFWSGGVSTMPALPVSLEEPRSHHPQQDHSERFENLPLPADELPEFETAPTDSEY